MENIIVTGGTGSGGSYLCEYLVKNHPEYNIIATTRWHSTGTLRNVEDIKDKIEIVECDLNDLSNVIRMFDKYKPIKVFNLAATANVYLAFKIPLAVLQNNIFSTAHILEAIRLTCPNTILQQCSTSEVIGTPKTIPITEDHPLNPSNAYAISKLAGEKLTCAYAEAFNLKVVVTRAFCYINPKRRDLFATSFAMQVARIEAGKQDVLKHGNLKSIRTIMDVRDMAEAYWVASNECEYSVPYNIGGETPITVGEFLELLKSKAKCPIKSEMDPLLLRLTDITSQVPDTSRFFNKTGWKQKITLDESIEWLLTECRKVVANEG